MLVKKAFFVLAVLLFTLSMAYADEDGETVTLVGKCYMSGSANFKVLQFSVSKTENYSLSGVYYNELKNLEGITVKILAKPAKDKGSLKGLEVIEYEILDVGKGIKPFVGLLKVFNNKLSLVIKDSPMIYELIGNSAVLKRLGDLYNGKVWIAGDVEDGKLRIRKYGVIRSDKK